MGASLHRHPINPRAASCGVKTTVFGGVFPFVERDFGMLIGYARVSTHDQNADLQIDALKAAGCGRVFVETASGGKAGRPVLKEALAALRTGDSLMIWKLDRLARSLKQLVETLEMLQAGNIGLVSLTEAINTKSAGGRLVLHMFGAIAEFERTLIRERTLAGLAAARARGRIGGRPRKAAA